MQLGGEATEEMPCPPNGWHIPAMDERHVHAAACCCLIREAAMLPKAYGAKLVRLLSSGEQFSAVLEPNN
eukprot:4206281-Amphidinium_carterae.1